MTASGDEVGRRVLMLMPTQKDAERTASLLHDALIPSVVCGDLTALCRALREGAGAALITDEALASDSAGQLAESVRTQPSWSSIPFIMLARDVIGTPLERAATDTLGNVVVVERPVQARTLASVVLSALRSRSHQYNIRDALLTLERRTTELRKQEERLQFALSAGKLGSWELELSTQTMKCSELCKLNFGRPVDQEFTYAELHETVHPLDRARVRAAIEHTLKTGADYDIEYRIGWHDGTTHWVLVRGRVAYDDQHEPTHMIGISLDVTARKLLEQALVQSQSELGLQADQLLAADRRKDEFLATLAHELRNPLAPIRTGLDVLRATSEPRVATHTMAVMDRQLAHMVRLIDDLLDVSRITRGKLELKQENIALADVIDAAIEASRPSIEERAHTLHVTLPPSAVWLNADLTRMAQVISNLLNNASKYTDRAGAIDLSARLDGDEVVIQVRDSGIGIPRESLDSVFEMFSQVDQSPHPSQGGLGIGLALVRSLVEMHGGRVSAESEGLGRGSTFCVRLPTVSSTLLAEAQPSLESAHSPVARTILVVDDNQDAAALLSLMMQSAGHRTFTASDGSEALDVARANSPHAIFLDIGMPGMNGYEVARRLRSEPQFESTVLIALTGWGSRDDKQKAMDAGFDFHLTKPVDSKDVHRLLDQLARRADARQHP